MTFDDRGNPADPLYKHRLEATDAAAVRASFARLTAEPAGTPTGVGGGTTTGPVTFDQVAIVGTRRYLFTPGDPSNAAVADNPRLFNINASALAQPHPTNPRLIVFPTLGS